MNRSWRRVLTMSAGVLCAFVVLLSPALLPDEGVAIVLAGVLPLSFFAAGAVAQVLRPRNVVGLRILQVGLLHLGSLAGGVLAGMLENWPAGSAVIAIASTLAFAAGFVLLLDLLVRYPDGHYAWPWVRFWVRFLALGSLVLVVVSSLASRRVPSVIGVPGPANPAYVPALHLLSDAAAVVALTPVLGFLLLGARYARAPSSDRIQMRWPMVTALLVAVGLVTSGLAERLLGAPVQTAVFVTAAAALPASFLIGLLRHSEEAERLAAVEASRARIAEATAKERRRIERDLHDGAQQQLVALLARVELARSKMGDADPRMDQELREIREGIAQAHRELRELARGIHPAALTDHGLAEAVRSAMSRMPEGAFLDVAPGVEGTRYPRSVEETAYLFVLEGVTNALRHANDACPTVRLGLVGSDLVVTVSDAGRGFVVEENAGSGLTGLRDRLAAVGGTLVVESSAGVGTRLSATFPVSTRATR